MATKMGWAMEGEPWMRMNSKKDMASITTPLVSKEEETRMMMTMMMRIGRPTDVIMMVGVVSEGCG